MLASTLGYWALLSVETLLVRMLGCHLDILGVGGVLDVDAVRVGIFLEYCCLCLLLLIGVVG